jgi:type II restriction enzyme
VHFKIIVSPLPASPTLVRGRPGSADHFRHQLATLLVVTVAPQDRPSVDPHDELLRIIERVSQLSSANFDTKARVIDEWLESQPDERLESLLAAAGFIPEAYDHDSSEEKIYAKAMDMLIAVALRRIGFDARVSAERSNSADVLASAIGDEGPYSMVLDAKAFRLSRTALNPKDYKIEALSTWRKGADYAVLVGPIAGFPEGNSRLFVEASRFAVTLITFSHLACLLRSKAASVDKLRRLWGSTPNIRSVSSDLTATQYWLEVDGVFCEASGISMTEWKIYRRRYFQALISVADHQVQYYLEQERQVRAMDKETLATLAIRALKIEGRIATIRQRAIKTRMLLDSVDSQQF